jgi:asparagine synthase (glutamine-hydrolysing)
MCGICGKLQFNDQATVPRDLVDRMMGAMAYRGPDGRGTRFSGPVGLGHVRLAIIDLSTGAQPLANEDETIWLIFNGEIYNFQQLRADLVKQGHTFRTTSDTEVIIHLYEKYGVESLSRLRGMFAFALWDEKEQTLLLARDRVGIKPLYYADTGKALVFGSEIKALLADPEVTCRLDPQSVDRFLTHLCLPGKETLWKGVKKLEPGCYLLARKGKTEVRQYWDLRFNQQKRWRSLEEAAEALYELTRATVRDHMISDVPVGFLLSGGVDSTIVLSCAATETNKKISTYTVGFADSGFDDERPYAKLAAQRFGAEYNEITFTPKEFWEFLPSLVWHMEEPVCDPPAVSLHYVSKLARRQVTVLLSGEGGDEAFGGYHEYRNFMLLERAKSAGPLVRGALSAGLRAANHFGPLRKAARFAPFVTTDLPHYYYSRVASPFSYFNRNKSDLYSSDFGAMVQPGRSIEVIGRLFEQVRGQPLLNQMQYIDIKTNLPEDLLIKADRITMGNSLELRVPFLDHELLEFASGLPPDYRVKNLATKRILKQAFKGRIPPEIIGRKKAGFPLPLQRWLQLELRNQVREVLLSQRSLGRGFFRKQGLEKMLALGDAGQPLAKEIFSLLTMELLLQQFPQHQA